jgi:hypothetical protein
MKKIALILSIFTIVTIAGCNTTTTSDPTPTVQTLTETLVTNPWKVDKVTDATGSIINPNSLPAESRALFAINIQFNEDKTVRAIDPVARTIVNGGSWGLLDNNQTLDINISQLKGQFPIVSAKKDRMILKNKVVFQGLSFDVNLELIPAL